MGERVSEVFIAIVEYATRQGARSIKDLPGLYEFTHGGFTVKVNGHKETIEAVPAFHAAIYREDGFPLGIVSPSSGMMLAGSEEAFLRAFAGYIPPDPDPDPTAEQLALFPEVTR